jgi:hypothetical protein
VPHASRTAATTPTVTMHARTQRRRPPASGARIVAGSQQTVLPAHDPYARTTLPNRTGPPAEGYLTASLARLRERRVSSTVRSYLLDTRVTCRAVRSVALARTSSARRGARTASKDRR